MWELTISYAVATLKSRFLSSEKGFALQEGGVYRPDATAWAILALRAWGGDSEMIHAACQRLIQDQQPDGRVCVAPQHPNVYWPTAISVLAWRLQPQCDDARQRAVQFLLTQSGDNQSRFRNNPAGHDPTLRGWSWIEGTHSWVEPTAMTLMALKTEGYRDHPRVKDGAAMLLDRQLPGGGWNYGNTLVFGRELRPYVHSTGMSLTALAGLVSESEVEKSLIYLQTGLAPTRTPLSLGWGLMGLAAWGRWPVAGFDWIKESFTCQEKYGPYNTSWLALLLLAVTPPSLMDCLVGEAEVVRQWAMGYRL